MKISSVEFLKIFQEVATHDQWTNAPSQDSFSMISRYTTWCFDAVHFQPIKDESTESISGNYSLRTIVSIYETHEWNRSPDWFTTRKNLVENWKKSFKSCEVKWQITTPSLLIDTRFDGISFRILDLMESPSEVFNRKFLIAPSRIQVSFL